jgi:hypothetical protein
MRIDLNKKLSKNFTLGEFIASDTAKKKGIDNTPTLADIYHMEELCVNLLQPIRDAWGKPIKVTSGFRCYLLNKLLGGSPTSVHPRGWAVDIKPMSGSYKEFEEFVINFLMEHPEIKYDQVIRETSGNSKWLHLGYKNNAGRQRKMLFDISK